MGFNSAFKGLIVVLAKNEISVSCKTLPTFVTYISAYAYIVINIKIVSQKIGLKMKFEGVEKILVLCIPVLVQLIGVCYNIILVLRSGYLHGPV
jgi:hypothetical protein